MRITSTSIKWSAAVLLVAVSGTSMVSFADSDHKYNKDFGTLVEKLLSAKSEKLFGIKKPLKESAPATSGDYRRPDQTAGDQVALAKGLKAKYLTRVAGNHTDMMAFWPSEKNATHLIACVEGGREVIGTNPDGSDKYNPSVQRIDLKTGAVQTVLRGMDRCDGIRLTPWGTILATEEDGYLAGDGMLGGAYEILDPMAITNATVIDRKTGEVSAPNEIAKRDALPSMAWEGLTVLKSGVVIAGDELRPGTSPGAKGGNGPDGDGGSIFKFVPDQPYDGSSPITSLAMSPLASGSTYALQVSCVNNKQQFGQGCGVGNAAWIMVSAAAARSDANANGATGFYRPEDLHRDPRYRGDGVRFCWTDTGNEGADNFAEVMCGVDAAPLTADATQRSVVINRFVEGDKDFNSFDNLAFQPKTGNLYVVEDHPNGDVFACLPDGADRDIKTDGCIKMLSVKDTSAEPTGFLFSADGKTAYVSIQHSKDGLMPLYDGYRTDDVIKITGFKLRHRSNDDRNEYGRD